MKHAVRWVRQHRAIILFFLGTAAFYFLAALWLRLGTNVYDAAGRTGICDLFGMDDYFYLPNLFSGDTISRAGSVAKHPLYALLGQLVYGVLHFCFGSVSATNLYFAVVCLQIAVMLLSLFYLYRILCRIFCVSRPVRYLLLTIYCFSFATLIFTLLCETYIYASAFLLASFYHIYRKDWGLAVLFGVLCGGFTVTNLLMWGLMLLFLTRGDWRKKVLAALSAGGLLLLLITLSPVRDTFFKELWGTASSEAFVRHFGPLGLLRRAYYFIFGSATLYIDTALTTPYGNLPGTSISFLPSGSLLVTALIALWGSLQLWALRCWRDRRVWVPLLLLAYNLVLHILRGFGILEGNLFALHHLFAQLLLVAALFLPADDSAKVRRLKTGALAAFTVGMVVVNAVGLIQLVPFLHNVLR